MKKEKVIVIVGPTASGKTSLGIELAKKIGGEIISCDSMQIYKGLDVGTAKATKEEQEEVKHHLIDIIDYTEKFSVAEFKALCYDKIDEILKKGKTPILVGGTGLYINSVILDMNFEKLENDKDVQKYREYLYDLAKTKSNDFVYNMLVKVDKEAAKEIHKNNLKRVIRALEIAKFQENNKSHYMLNEKNRIENLDLKYDFLVYYIDMDRDILYQRINFRVDKMMQNNKILDEAKMLYDNKESLSSTCLQAIGYKEFFDYFDGKTTLENCVQKLKQNTRNYAKRQITWFKNKTNCKKINGLDESSKNVKLIMDDFLD